VSAQHVAAVVGVVVAGHELRIHEHTARVGASIGAAMLRGRSAAEAIVVADAAMYQAKASGGTAS
jgi:GGDEF domain-containing protein